MTSWPHHPPDVLNSSRYLLDLWPSDLIFFQNAPLTYSLSKNPYNPVSRTCRRRGGVPWDLKHSGKSLLMGEGRHEPIKTYLLDLFDLCWLLWPICIKFSLSQSFLKPTLRQLSDLEFIPVPYHTYGHIRLLNTRDSHCGTHMWGTTASRLKMVLGCLCYLSCHFGVCHN